VVSEALFHWFERQPYLQELNRFLEQYRPWLCDYIDGGEAIGNRLERIATTCAQRLNESPARIDRASVTLRLCHVDPNPANIIWSDDGRLRWVDWNTAAGATRLGLAEFRWHRRFLL
jgi:thiamine kinase-like enzyme